MLFGITIHIKCGFDVFCPSDFGHVSTLGDVCDKLHQIYAVDCVKYFYLEFTLCGDPQLVDRRRKMSIESRSIVIKGMIVNSELMITFGSYTT